MTAISVETCTVAFGGLKAIDDVTLDVPGQAITALIGPNGSGKSTFVNMVSGQIPPRSGKIRLGGEPINGLRPDLIVHRGLARTYQVPRVPKELTIEEVISVPLTYARSGRALPGGARSAGDLARYCGLRPAVSTRCGQLSVSDLRRLEIARALACRPTVLLLDEAMAGLSLEDTDQVIGLVREIHASGVTVVVIEHVMRIIARLCGHAIVLNQGRLLAQGKPQDVLQDAGVREAYLGKGFSL
ncbi:ABC transporter ATP-binding protein [Bosea sp. BIWAKO-01]|uniref:ABC transporter ATP-binding protein n=1 Tax=Bosea sp. BIWAKO-01 TaxID=506668 RepID=UPI000852BDFE|nr:ABC transporter ATP-binding protein [Bosea sp. BIWAKO-01]GAU86897.1 branched-chain amino acid transport ATP-binding protein LivG [Bosea sp. BIWAKO-01]